MEMVHTVYVEATIKAAFRVNTRVVAYFLCSYHIALIIEVDEKYG